MASGEAREAREARDARHTHVRKVMVAEARGAHGLQTALRALMLLAVLEGLAALFKPPGPALEGFAARDARAHATGEARAVLEAREVLEVGAALEAQEATAVEVQTIARVSRVLNLVGRLVPSRIADEELGDAEEHILRMVERGKPPRLVYLKVMTTILWMLLNALRASARRAMMKKVVKRKS